MLWRWEATRRPLAVDDILVYLGLLPLVVFGFALALRWAWRSAAARQAPPVAAASATGAAAPPPSSAGAAERHASVQLLAACIASACGDDPAALPAAARAGEPRPGIDPELRDDDGLPVLCARIADLPAADLDAALAAARAADPAFAHCAAPEHVQRAIAALAAPLQQALAALLPWQAHVAAQPQCRLRLLVGWPAAWSDFDAALGDAWLQQCTASHAPVPPLVTAARLSGVALWRQADQVLLTLQRQQRADPVLVAACHSDIGDEAVAALDRAGLLFSSRRQPKGRMPGEAAAALLLAGAAWPADPDADAPPVRLHRAACADRDKPVDAAGRVASDVLLAVLNAALAAAEAAATAVAAVACDADRHTARGTELFGATLAALPQLDAGDDLVLLGAQLGSTGGAGTLLAVSAAAALARERDAPCLALSLSDPTQRLALVATTASLESPAR